MVFYIGERKIPDVVNLLTRLQLSTGREELTIIRRSTYRREILMGSTYGREKMNRL